MATPKLSKAALAALHAAADGTLGRAHHDGITTTRLGGATVKDLHIRQLTELGYITDGRATTYRQLYAITDDGSAYLASITGDTDAGCPGCGWSYTSPHYRPGRVTGMCAHCWPRHVRHYILAGDFATYCGVPRRDVDADPAQDYTDAEVDSTVNCVTCNDVKTRRR